MNKSFLLEFQDTIYEPWQIEYVAYEAIREGLYEVCDSGHWTAKDEKDFESAIRLEAGKVDLFINRKQREIDSRIGHCQRILLSQQNSMNNDTRTATDSRLLTILADINELSRYTRINFKALEHLIQEHDKLTNTNRQSLLVEICRTRPLDSQRFDSVLVQVSSLLDISRKTPFSWSEPSAPKLHIKRDYKNSPLRARYWVHKDNITEVKATLLFNLPIYISEPTIGFEQTEQSNSVVYFDTDKFSQYLARLQCDDGAEIISCRWQDALEKTNQVCIERKTFVKTDSGGGGSVIDQICMRKDRVQSFLLQSYSAEEYAQDLKSLGFDQDYIDSCYTIAQSIQKSVLEKRLSPKLRVFFNRLLFQSPQNQTLSVSLDNNVAFIKDGNRNMDEWCRQDIGVDYPFKSVDAQDINLFPHAILETQITGDEETPHWLSKLLDSKLVFEVPRFSTYIHGVAQFWSPLLPLLPWWLSHIDSDIRAGKQEKLLIEGAGQISGLSRSNSLRPNGQYRMGYLESQLGKKGDLRPKLTDNVSDRKDNASENLKSNFILQVEDTGDNNSRLSLQRSRTINSRVGLRSRYPESMSSQTKEKNSFIDYYYKGRNNKSQAYMLQDADTVKNNDEVRKAAIIEMGEEKEKKKKKGKKAKPPSHTMEPKVFFANERTFIHWLQFSALILTAALTLLNFGDRISTIAGATFFGVSLVIAIYAFLRNRYRAYQISTRPNLRYDDLYGPIGLCCLLIGAMVVRSL
jgi:SPX domain protein involved in polyphosphate accumulation/uncharacterized membrane protein YidH (DUF202 family)